MLYNKMSLCRCIYVYYFWKKTLLPQFLFSRKSSYHGYLSLSLFCTSMKYVDTEMPTVLYFMTNETVFVSGENCRTAKFVQKWICRNHREMYVCFDHCWTWDLWNQQQLQPDSATVHHGLHSGLWSQYVDIILSLRMGQDQEQDSVQFSPYDRHTCHLPEENLIELTCLPET